MSKLNEPWEIVYSDEAKQDLNSLDTTPRNITAKAIEKVSRNPLPQNEGGYGKPLSGELAGCLKIKLKKIGIRVVYKLARTEKGMKIIIIGARSDEEVYKEAAKRIKKLL